MLTKNKNTKFSGWTVLLGCFLILFFGSALFGGTAGLFLSPICEELGFDTSEYSILYMFSAASTSIATAFFLPKIHTGNMKRLMFIALIVMTAGFAGYYFCKKVWSFWIVGFIANLGLSFFMQVPVGMMITNWFEDKRSMAMSIAMSANGLGGAIWALIIGKIIYEHGWRIAYLAEALLGFVVLSFAIIFLLKRSPKEYGQEPFTSKTTPYHKAPSNETVKNWKGLSKKEAIKTLPFYLSLIRAFIVGIYGAGVATHVVTFLLTRNWDYMASSTVVTVYQVFSVIGLLIGGIFVNRFGLKKSSVFFGSLLTLSCVSLALSGVNHIFAYIYGISGGLSGAILYLIPSLLISEVFGTKDYTGIYSLSNALSLVGNGIGATFIAILSKSISYEASFFICAAMCIIVILADIISLIMGKKYRKQTM